ncbi:helix-turn-helix transcriptional regulator [Atopobium sp. oral taxon 810]|uniref:helix-turn-helix transcriptional regulator n=1 Tax=Atopobium sp. oral taxon 810 TaxID=712158 RepID=UPI001E42D5C6|nr:helix-turn-helix transcriptional regulator [Atopobium sp. oral taxon 810]
MRRRQPDIAWGALMAETLLTTRLWQGDGLGYPGIFAYLAMGIIAGAVFYNKIAQTDFFTVAHGDVVLLVSGYVVTTYTALFFAIYSTGFIELPFMGELYWVWELLPQTLIIISGALCTMSFAARAQTYADKAIQEEDLTVRYGFSLLLLAGFCQSVSQIFPEHLSLGYNLISTGIVLVATLVLLYCGTPQIDDIACEEDSGTDGESAKIQTTAAERIPTKEEMIAKAHALEEGFLQADKLATQRAVYMGLFACGLFIWNVVTRVVSMFAVGVIACMLLALLLILLALSLWGMKKDSIAPTEDNQLKKKLAELRTLCVEADLSDRETAAVELMLKGKTSADSAEELGISASTVRTYLRRSYKKLGVVDGQELMSQLNWADDSTSARSEEEPQANENHSFQNIDSLADVSQGEWGLSGQLEWMQRLSLPSWLHLPRCLELCGPISLIYLLLLPIGATNQLWGSGRHIVLGVALAFVVCGALRLYAEFHQTEEKDEEDAVAFSGIEKFLLVVGIVFMVGICVKYTQTYIRVKDDGLLDFAALGYLLAYFSLTSCIFLCIRAAIHTSRACEFIQAIAVAAGMMAFSLFGDITWLIAIAVSAAFTALFVVDTTWIVSDGNTYELKGECSQRMSQLQTGAMHVATIGAAERISLCLLACALGFVFEESWRIHTLLCALPAFVPFIATLVFLSGFILIKHRIARLLIPVSIVCVSGMLLIAQQGIWNICPYIIFAWCPMVVAAVFVHYPWLSSILEELSPVNGLSSVRHIASVCLICFGVGAVFGSIAVDKYATLLIANSYYFEWLGGPTILRQIFLFCSGMGSVLACAAAIFCYVQISGRISSYELTDKLPQSLDERILYLFASRGLSEIQAQSLLGVIRGRTTREIASHLGYSSSSISAARSSGYKILGISSRDKLVDFVSHGLGM